MISGLAEVSSIREKRALHARKLSLALCAMRLRPPPSPVSLYSETQRAPPWTPESARDATDLSHTHIVRRPTDDLQTTGSRESVGGLAAAHERADARWVRCARRRRAPLPRARRAGAASRVPGPEPEERLEDHGSLQPALKRSTPCRQRSTPCRPNAQSTRRLIIGYSVK